MAKNQRIISISNTKFFPFKYILILILTLIQLNKYECGSCSSSSKISDTSTCFNEIIKFPLYYRAGQFTVRKDGVLFIEYSNGGSRLFYGLNTNGRGYFQDEESTKKIRIEAISSVNQRYESKNILVYLKTDTNRRYQYILSVSSYICLVELHDLDNNKIKTWLTSSFLGITDEKYVFSHQFSLIEKKDENVYYAAYVQYEALNINKEAYSISYTLTKFAIKDFSSDNIKTKMQFFDNYDNRIVSAFILEKYQYLIVFFVKTSPYAYYIRRHNLNTLQSIAEKSVYSLSSSDDGFPGNGLYFKAINLKDDYALFIFFTTKDNGKSLKIRLLQIKTDLNYDTKISIDLTKYNLTTSITLNEFYKINNIRFLLASTIDQNTLVLIFLDTLSSYTTMKMRSYKFPLDGYKFHLELSIDFYNDFLMFTSALKKDGVNNFQPILLFFSYPNGTDFYMNISPYVMDSGYYQNGNNLITYLLNKCSMDNNIFGYTKINEIKLISIPPEILFYRIGNEDTPLINGEKIGPNHILKQNKNLIKYNQNYILEYQFMAEGPTSYSALYNQAHERQDLISGGDYESGFTQKKIYYGRVNRLTFKLCHDYCETCKELGNSVDNQKCKTCLPLYRYDYFNFFNIYPENCVPEGYYNDLVTPKIIQCTTTNSKYYINITDSNKKICFDKLKECPSTYSYLNTTTNQCIDYHPIGPSTIIQDKPEISTVQTHNEKPPFPSTIIQDKPELSTVQTPNEKPPSPSTIIKEKEITIPDTKKEEETEITEKIEETEQKVSIEKSNAIITTSLSSEYDYDKCPDIDNNYNNLTNKDLYDIIKNHILSNKYPNYENIICEGKSGYSFEVTTSENEIESLHNNNDNSLPLVYLGNCEEALRQGNNIEGNKSLIIYKFYQNEGKAHEKNLQFEVYDPYTYKRLNLSCCENIDIYIPLDLKEKNNIYKNILDQGYDPFDLGDKFYREICTQYKSENGTDVLLDAREEYYYSPIINETTCQGNCRFSSYSLDTKYLKCECDVELDGIVTLDIKHLDEKNLAYSFYSSLKLSNYKVVICYNLVFNFKVFCHNYGSIIATIFFGLYVISLIYYSIRNIEPLKVPISKFLFEIGENKNITSMETKKINIKTKTSKSNKTKNKNNKNNNNNKALPPKKLNINNVYTKKAANTKDSELNLKSSKSRAIKAKNNNDVIINKNSSITLLKKKEKSDITLTSKPNKKFNLKEKIKDPKNVDNTDINPDFLDNYEYNNLQYEQACEYDKRTFCRTYYSVVIREELVLFTFFAWKDYNLIYVKFARFLILICSSLAMNALFFFHKTMYRKQNIEENYSFIQKLPQLIFTLVASRIIEVYLCFLSMTDSHIYAIKQISLKSNEGKKVIDIIDCMKRKLIIFFVSTFILFLLFWYFISAFCAVYQNTQKIFLRDSAISFVSSLIEPFLTFGFTTILRKISLSRCCIKKAGCLYKLSDIIPLF